MAISLVVKARESRNNGFVIVRSLKDAVLFTDPKCTQDINAKNISILENDKLEIGKKRALQLAAAFDVHPVSTIFPEYESKEIQKAA